MQILNMATQSRTSQAIHNSIYGIIASVLNVILNLVVRIVIVRYLGDQINGLHSLFISTISVLALVETGFSTAMIIHLYEPVLNKNYELIAQLLRFYKSVYIKIAFCFLLLGIIVDVFFIDRIVTTSINMWMVRFFFILFILSFFANYLTFYKRSLLFAEQKNRISIMSTTVSELLFRTVAMILAITTHQYTFFLICLILERLFGNYLCIRYVDKYYPQLKRYNTNLRLSDSIKSNIFKTVKPLMVNQISATVQRASNSILISALLGNVAIVGYYGSYQLVTSTIELLMAQIGGAFTSGFGNLAAENNKESMYVNYLKATFVMCFIASMACSTVMSCIQEIILVLFGTNFLLPMSAVLLIVWSSYIGLVNIPIISVQNAMGIHRLDSKYMAIQAIVAIVFGYVGGRVWGMNGILIGLILPTIVLTSLRKGLIINRIVFGVSWLSYITILCREILKCAIAMTFVVMLCSMIKIDNAWIAIVVKGFLGLVISFLALSIFSYRNAIFQQYKQMLLSKLKFR